QAVGPRLDDRVDGCEGGEDGRTDEPEVFECWSWQALHGRRQQPDRPRRIRHGEHQDREGDEVARHGTALFGISPTSRGTANPTNGPSTPPAMTPTVGLMAIEVATAMDAPAIAAASSRRPVISPTA